MPKVSKPRRHGNRWRINFLDADGVRKFETYPTFREATDALAQRQSEANAIKAGTAPRPPTPHTFDELCDYWLEHRTPEKRSPKDDRSIIEAHLRPMLGGTQIVQIGVQHVDRYCRGRRHLSSKTIHNHLTLLISMLNLAVDLGWLVAVPRIRKPKLLEEDYLWLRSNEEIRRFLDAAREEAPGIFELYATAVYSGMRAGELLGLKWADVDFERRLITVKRSYDKPTKTGAIRHVPILDPLLPTLRAWRLRCGSEWVFPSKTGTMLGPSARVLQEVFKKCLERAGLVDGEKRITFHDLRHTFASHWVMRGGDLYRLQRILGHKSVQMTQRYAHLAPEVYSEDWGRLEDVVSQGGEVLELRLVDGAK